MRADTAQRTSLDNGAVTVAGYITFACAAPRPIHQRRAYPSLSLPGLSVRCRSGYSSGSLHVPGFYSQVANLSTSCMIVPGRPLTRTLTFAIIMTSADWHSYTVA